jgi:hypothetical protein
MGPDRDAAALSVSERGEVSPATLMGPPFGHVEIDSEVERRFAKALDDHESVKYFVKLPVWFTVDTPLGPYASPWKCPSLGGSWSFATPSVPEKKGFSVSIRP